MQITEKHSTEPVKYTLPKYKVLKKIQVSSNLLNQVVMYRWFLFLQISFPNVSSCPSKFLLWRQSSLELAAPTKTIHDLP